MSGNNLSQIMDFAQTFNMKNDICYFKLKKKKSHYVNYTSVKKKKKLTIRKH